MAFSQYLIPLFTWLVIRGLNGSGDVLAFHPVWYDPIWVAALWASLRYSDRIEPMLIAVARWSYRHYKPALIIPTITVPIIFIGIFRLQVLPVFDGDLPEDNQKVMGYRAYEKLKGTEHSFVFTVHRDAGVLDDASMQMIKELETAAATLPGVYQDSILSYRTIRTIARGDGDDVDVRKLDRILEDVSDPARRHERMEQLVRTHPLAYGRLIDRSEKMAVIQVRYDYTVDRVALHRNAMRIVKEFDARYPGTDFGVVGFDILEQQVMLEIIFMTVVLSTIAKLITFLLLSRSFGVYRNGVWRWSNLSGVVFTMGPLMFYPNVWVMGGLGWAGIGIDTVSAVIPIVFIVVASSYGIHFVYHVAESKEAEEIDRVLDGMRAVYKALFGSALTTAIGFFTLAPFAVVSIRKFGIFAGIGVMIMLIVIYVMGPAWCRFWPIPRRAADEEAHETVTVRATRKLAAKGLRYPWIIIACVAALVVFVAREIPGLDVGSNPTEFLKPGGIFPRASALLSERFGANGAIFTAYRCGAPDCVLEPENLRAIDGLARHMEAVDSVAFVQSFAEEERYLNERFADGTGIPDSRDAAEQLLLVYEMAGTQSQFISDDRSTAFLMAWGDYRDSHAVDRLYAETKRYAAGAGMDVAVGSEYVLWSAQTDYIVRGKIVSWVQSLSLIMLGGWAIFGSAIAGVIVSLPLLASTLLLLALMSALSIPLDTATTVITSITIGVSADYGIHVYNTYLRMPQGDERLRDHLARIIHAAAPPVTYDAESNAIGFSVLILSDLLPLTHCGYMLITSMVVAGVGALLLVPLALRLLHRERLVE